MGVVAAPAALAADPAGDTSTSNASAQYVSGTWNTGGVTASFAGNGTGPAAPLVDLKNSAAAWQAGDPDDPFADIALGSERAVADTAGQSWAASGRVTDGAGTGAATINLDSVLASAGLDGVLSKFELNLQQISSIAKLDASSFDSATGMATTCASDSATNCRDYTLEAGDLHMTSPAVAALYTKVHDAAVALDSAIGAYTKDLSPTDSITQGIINLSIGTAMASAVAGTPYAGSASNFLKYGHVSATLTVTSQVAQTLVDVLRNWSVGGVDIDFEAGTLDVHLSQIMSPLNGRGPNTPIFAASTFADIATAVDAAIDQAVDQIIAKVTELLNSVDVDVEVSTSGELVAVWQESCSYFDLLTFKWVDGSCPKIASGPFNVVAHYSGGLLDVATGNGDTSVDFTTPATSPDQVQDVIAILNGADWGAGVRALVGSLSDNGYLDEDAIKDQISDLVNGAAGDLKEYVAAGSTQLGVQLRSLADVFNGTINAQDVDPATGGYRVSALVLRFGADAAAAAPSALRSGSAFQTAPRPAAINLPPVTIRLATSIVGPNETETTCQDGQHYENGQCVDDPDDNNNGNPSDNNTGNGNQGSSTTGDQGGSTPSDGGQSVEVEGESDEAAPKPDTVEEAVDVKGVSQEVVDAAPSALAETGPRELGIMGLLGLELLLAGVAINRLTTRRSRRALADGDRRSAA